MKYLILIAALCIAVNSKAQENGKELFDNNCAACHLLEGPLVGPPLKGITDKREEEWIKAFIKNSTKMIADGDEQAKAIFEEFYMLPMTSFEGVLSDEQIDAIIVFLREASTPPPVAEVEKEVVVVEEVALVEPELIEPEVAPSEEEIEEEIISNNSALTLNKQVQVSRSLNPTSTIVVLVFSVALLTILFLLAGSLLNLRSFIKDKN